MNLTLGTLPLHFGPAFVSDAIIFFVSWFAVLVIFIWNKEFRIPAQSAAESLGAAVFILLAGYALESYSYSQAIFFLTPFELLCMAGALMLGVWAIARPTNRPKPWAARAVILRIAQSPFSGEPLHMIHERNAEFLASPSGERFPIREGIPVLLRPEDLSGLNGKYNKLYEVIGGMYDDSQRVICALSGFNRDVYVMSYLGFLEVKQGDRVLETSVGTGLNFQYLPRGVRLAGMDLSAEMLNTCQTNLRRWQLEADLFLGNAESLPFADESFDVVFHVGGINFFNDRARAIREMIRVAKPGSRILIADETEEHVKRSFESFPISGELYKNRTEAVVAPIDLVPAEMKEVHLEILNVVGKNRFYALTFRKPTEESTGSCVAATGAAHAGSL
jgi:ubiquinone/menaquinone biosynthesis C-methylase UbiE/uncharacterized protein YbaR (Trm112 family)